MQLIIKHKLTSNLILPIGYHHIIQSILYDNMRSHDNYSGFIHNEGYSYEKRQYRMFTFSLLEGRYEIKDGKICFRDEVSFEVRSPDNRLIQIIKENIDYHGIKYPNMNAREVELTLSDARINDNHIIIKMISPLTVYSTDKSTKHTYYYSYEDAQFTDMVNDNFKRKYNAYTGIAPDSDILIRPINVRQKDKYVTKYKGYYVSGWKGEYELKGEEKYLDFLYQAGIGAKNSQGFGLFHVI